jgi:SEC-C motif
VPNGDRPIAGFSPDRYNEIPVVELLRAASRGWIGVDRRLIQSIIDHPNFAADVLAFSREPLDDQRLGLDPVLTDLFRYAPTPEAIPFFMDTIRRQPDDVEDSLIQALLPFGAQAIEPLLALYEELGEEQGSDVAFLLAGLRIRDPRVRDLLLDRLEFDAADGAFCLGLYGDASTKPALEKMLAEVSESPEEDDDDGELHREISHALEALDAPEPEYKAEPFDILADYPKKELPDFDSLSDAERIELLSSLDADIRAEAAYSFFNNELHPKVRAALWEMARNDADAKVRGRAWESLADVTSEAPVRDAMLAVLNDTSKLVTERGGAAVGLYGVADRAEIRKAVEALYEEGGASRVKALETMWRSLWKPYARFFAPHLDDKDVATLHQALRGAGYFRLTAMTDKIAKFFDDDDLREDALFAYALAMPGETTRGRAKGMLRKIDSITPLTQSEARLVAFAIDERLRLHGLEPVFENAGEDDEEVEAPAPAAPPAVNGKPGRNDPCPCGSGQKYKKCHGK